MAESAAHRCRGAAVGPVPSKEGFRASWSEPCGSFFRSVNAYEYSRAAVHRANMSSGITTSHRSLLRDLLYSGVDLPASHFAIAITSAPAAALGIAC